MTSNEIKELVEIETGIEISEKTRLIKNVIIRSIFFALCRKNTLESYESLSHYYTGKHSTTLLSVRKFHSVYSQEPKVMETFTKLDSIINGIDYTPIKQEIKTKKIVESKWDRDVFNILHDHIKTYSDEDIMNLIEYRIKPYSKMIKK